MVLQGVLARMGLGGLQGLSQGGGFGLGYGFMVRAGYDLYGALRDKFTDSLTNARYTPGNTGVSMMGTGGLMGMQRTNPKQAGTPQQIRLLEHNIGKSNVNNFLRKNPDYFNKKQPRRQLYQNQFNRTTTFNPTPRRPTHFLQHLYRGNFNRAFNF